MNTRRTMILTGSATALIFLLSLCLVVVREGEIAVVSTFGKPTRTVDQPGFLLRWPVPVQQVHRLDRRLQSLEGPLEQVQTRDGDSVIVTAFLGWRIADPVLFFSANQSGSAEQAGRNLNQLLSTAKLAAIGRYAFADLLNADPAKLRFEQVEQEILAAVAPQARRLYGVDVSLVGLRKISLPEATTEAVAARIRAERESLAEKFRSEGEAEATRIRARAQSAKDQQVADANARAKRIEAEGDAEAAAYYEVFRQNPDLAIFLRKLESLERTLQSKSTVVLTDDTPPFDLLKKDADREKAPAKP